MWFLIFAVVVAVFAGPVSGRAQVPEEEVVVSANAYPVPFENLSRAVTVITREDLQNLPVRSIADVLALSASVDMRPRSPLGAQTDISIRGAAFSQTLVLVDGIRINDSQTGHHNADFPVQLQDIERIEVLLGPGSSIYGADAFGGIVNIITRRQTEKVRASLTAGQNGLMGASFSTGFQKGRLSQSVSVTADRSSGFRYDREFRTLAVGTRLGIGNTSFVISHVNKEFGAYGFYGPSPSREWTNQTFVSAERALDWRPGTKTIFRGYYRTHGDRFLYDIRSPGLFESTHRTQSAGASAKTQYVIGPSASLIYGAELGGDWIRSSSLGDHEFARTSLYAEMQWNPGKKTAVYPGVRYDYYSNFGSAVSPSLSASWWMLRRVRLRASGGRAFRIPTFTELYYRDPNHQANTSLKPETAWSTELGTDFIPAGNWMGTLTVFSRHERNVIDWVRASSLEKWRTANMRKLHAAGIEIGLQRSFGTRAGVSAHYSRISIDAGAIGYVSKYVLDYARDSWSAAAFFPLPQAFAYRHNLSYKKRADGRSYWILDGRLERQFGKFAAGIDATNLLNSSYQEISGVDMPGRWLAFTIRTR